MASGAPPEPAVYRTRNTARFFVEHPHIAWVLLLATCLWGGYAFFSMPQRKDPEVQVRQAVAFTPWPGANAERIEQLVTRRVEEGIAGNAKVSRIESISRTSVSVVYVELDERLGRRARSSTTSSSGWTASGICPAGPARSPSSRTSGTRPPSCSRSRARGPARSRSPC